MHHLPISQIDMVKYFSLGMGRGDWITRLLSSAELGRIVADEKYKGDAVLNATLSMVF